MCVHATQAPPLEKPAKEYPFTLDPFQQAAIGFIEKGASWRGADWSGGLTDWLGMSAWLPRVMQ